MKVLINLLQAGILPENQGVEDMRPWLDSYLDEAKDEIFDFIQSEYNLQVDIGDAYLSPATSDEDYLFGANGAETLIECMECWNDSIRKEFEAALQRLHRTAEEEGPHYKGLPLDTTDTYRMKKAALELDNSWSAFSEHGVFVPNEFGNVSFTCILQDEQIDDIRRYPELYAIVTVYPK